MSFNDSPAILNVSDFNDSFKSVANENSLVSIPMTGLDSSSALSSHPNVGTLWKKRLDFFILFLLLGGCISVIIYLSSELNKWLALLEITV